MVKRVLALNEKFQGLMERTVALRTNLEKRVAPLVEQEAMAAQAQKQSQEAESKRLALEAEARKLAEAERAEKARIAEQEAAKAAQEAAQAAVVADRQAYEAELKGMAERDERLRKALESRLTIEAALSLLKASAPPAAQKHVLKVLGHIMKSVCDEPEREELRQIRIKNPQFQSDIAQWVGGEELLQAIGFRQVELLRGGAKTAHWELPEPQDLDSWPAWFDRLNAITNQLSALS